MYDDFLQMIDGMLADQHYNVSAAIEEMSLKYGIGQKTLYTRFHSYFHTSPKKYVSQLLTPSRDELASMILNTESVDELWAKLPRPYHFYNGIFDRVFGVSTYQKAKVKLLSEQAVTQYVVSREDNRSLIYSQLLGDGSYYKDRHALRISHGIKQAEYLRAKVGMLCKAYPKLPSKVKINTHTQGHQYADWWSGHLGNVDIPEKDQWWTLVEKLTPVGWLLWWLDDGCWAQNIQICICKESVEQEAVRVLKTYGIESRIGQGSLIMCGQENDVRFYKTFIEPLSYLIPECMAYKVKI